MDKESKKLTDEIENQTSVPPIGTALVPENDSGWRALKRVLWGLALCSLTLNFACLDYILPGIGFMLMLLGFRALRGENKWFLLSWIVAIVRTVSFIFALTINATIWKKTVFEQPPFSALIYLNPALFLLLLFFLNEALRSVQEKAGLQTRLGTGALIVWYLAMCFLAYCGNIGTVLTMGMLVAYLFILRNLFRRARKLKATDCQISAAPARLSDTMLASLLAGVCVLLICVGFVCFQSYPMKWASVGRTDSNELRQTEAALTSLGFPQAVLDDMSEADILECRGARRVEVQQEDFPVDEMWYAANGGGPKTLDNLRSLHFTHIAVQLPGDRDSWKIVHSFGWNADPGFHGTEALQIWPASHIEMGWGQTNDFSGRVLYSRDGVRYVAPYYSLSKQTYEKQDFFFGNSQKTDGFAAFSFPKGGENYRGYVSYTVQARQKGCIIDSWMNYVHQVGSLHFPAQTAMDFRMTVGENNKYPFVTLQDALQFDPNEADAKTPQSSETTVN